MTTPTKKSTQERGREPGSKKTTTFLDLPGELRNRVYKELLPDRDASQIDPGLNPKLREDGTTTSTAFMATCKQIHQEAASMLYGSGEVAFPPPPIGAQPNQEPDPGDFCERFIGCMQRARRALLLA